MSQDERTPFEEVRTSLRNRRKTAMTLRLEPWGDSVTIGAGHTVQIVARGPVGDTLEVDRGDDLVTVYAWPGSSVRVMRKGQEIDVASAADASSRPTPFDVTAPALPAGMRMREWIAQVRGT